MQHDMKITDSPSCDIAHIHGIVGEVRKAQCKGSGPPHVSKSHCTGLRKTTNGTSRHSVALCKLTDFGHKVSFVTITSHGVGARTVIPTLAMLDGEKWDEQSKRTMTNITVG